MEKPESREAGIGQGADSVASSAESARDRGEEAVGIAGLKTLLGIKNNHIREAYDRVASAEVAADEARAVREAAVRRMEDLEEQRDRLKERVREFEEEEGRRRRSRDDHDRRASRAVRDLEHKEAEISRLERELENGISLRDQALKEARGRIEGLERDLENRETEAAGLRSAIEGLRVELEEQKELQRRLAEPANRLRMALDLFNTSQHIKTVHTLSRDLGRPEVHAVLGDGDEPPAILAFTWQGITWQTYTADPGPAVEEPRVYLTSAGEDLSGVDRNPPNARIGPGGRVVLGL